MSTCRECVGPGDRMPMTPEDAWAWDVDLDNYKDHQADLDNDCEPLEDIDHDTP